MSNKILSLAVIGVLLGGAAQAAEYTVDTAKSKIAFSGEQAGTKFEGLFKNWTAKVDFDPQHLSTSHIDVTINTASAETGNKMYDGTLPQDDWFNTKQYPKAVFKSTKITADKDNAYQVEGDLTIREITKPVSFRFILDESKTPTVHAQSAFIVDRLVYGLGTKSDGKAEWVSKDINISLDITAVKKTN